MAAEETGAVAGRVAAVGEPLAEHGPGLHDDLRGAAVEEEVVVVGRDDEVGAGVDAERSRRAEAVAVLAVPHERVGDDEVAFRVAYRPDRVAAGGGPEMEDAEVGADEGVAVVGAATAIVDSEWVADWDVAAGCSAEGVF